MKLTVVTSAYNRPQYCIDFMLQSIINQTIQPEEVIITDDGSSIPTVKNSIEKFKDKLNIKYIWNNNPGTTANTWGYNCSIKQSKSDLTLICSSDIILSPNTIKNSIELLKNKTNEYIVGHVVDALTVTGTQKFKNTDYTKWYDKDFQESLDKRFSPLFESNGEKARLGPTDLLGTYQSWGSNCNYFCITMFTSKLYEMRGLNEDYSCCGGYEDYDFITRCKMATKQLWYGTEDNHEVCYHLGHWYDTPEYFNLVNNPSWGKGQEYRKMSSPPKIDSYITNIDKEWGIPKL